jgi:UDP-N-acetylmuramoyl-tripeptide--D-alanyl-D-alanine ligase
MEAMSLAEAAGALGARIPANGEAIIQSICTDSRQAAPGALFFALRGENSDGHNYVAQSLEKGCVAAVVEREVEGTAGPQLVVTNSLAALGTLAAHYRNRFQIPVVGITGSVGKTSTKEMVACAIGAGFNVLASRRNYNNEIGVPLTLFNLSSEHEAAVIEMGMRGAGQIAELCEIARPTHGLITNIGLSHIELLGSREEIARAKGELLECLPPDGTAILPADDDFIETLRTMAGHRPIRTFGVRNPADFRAEDVTFDPGGASRFTIRGVPFVIHAPGVHHVINACAASAVAGSLGLPLPSVAASLATFEPPSMRMQTLEIARGITLLNDAYNAAPDSMRAALDTLAMIAGGRRTVAILGDMRELGDWSEAAHRSVGDSAAGRIDLVITVGESSRWIAAEAEQGKTAVVSFPDTETAALEAYRFLLARDLVLIKGSRAMEMERIVDALAGSSEH